MFGRYRIDVGTGHLMDTGRHWGGSDSSNTTTTNSQPWQPQQGYLTDIFGKAQNWMNGGGEKQYTGQTYAGPTAPTQQAQQGELNYANTQAPQQVQTANNSWSNMVNGNLMNAEANPYLQSYMAAANRNLTNNLTQNILPGVSSAAEAQGAYGGAREGIAQTNAASMTNQMMADTDAMIANNGYNSGLQSMQYALGMTPTMQQVSTMPYVLQDQVGRAQQQDQQARLTNAEQNYYMGQQLPLQNLQNYAGLIQGNYGGQSTQTGPAIQHGGASGALGGALMGAKLGTMGVPGIGTGVGAALGGLVGLFA